MTDSISTAGLLRIADILEGRFGLTEESAAVEAAADFIDRIQNVTLPDEIQTIERSIQFFCGCSQNLTSEDAAMLLSRGESLLNHIKRLTAELAAKERDKKHLCEMLDSAEAELDAERQRADELQTMFTAHVVEPVDDSILQQFAERLVGVLDESDWLSVEPMLNGILYERRELRARVAQLEAVKDAAEESAEFFKAGLEGKEGESDQLRARVEQLEAMRRNIGWSLKQHPDTSTGNEYLRQSIEDALREALRNAGDG